jgi:AcrR family transcriptional regulator
LRNEDAAVDAILDLLYEGEIEPTAQAVAVRSGLSIRSIFRLFQDMEALHAAAIERHMARVIPLLAELPTFGPLDERIAALAADRARFYEAVAPVRRMAVRRAERSPVIAERLAWAGRYFRRQVAEIFAAELSAEDRPSGDGELLEGLDAATSWEMWDRLRRAQGLSVEAARQVVVATASALLPGAGPEAATTPARPAGAAARRNAKAKARPKKAAGGTPTAGTADH